VYLSALVRLQDFTDIYGDCSDQPATAISSFEVSAAAPTSDFTGVV
jgi:hypothetical protein